MKTFYDTKTLFCKTKILDVKTIGSRIAKGTQLLYKYKFTTQKLILNQKKDGATKRP